MTANERRISLTVAAGSPSTARFEALAPEFAHSYSGDDLRWVNVVRLSAYAKDNVATIFPFNTFDRTWPRLDYLEEPVVVGTEGWAFGQRFKDTTETIRLYTHEDAVVGSLKVFGIEAHLSEPGRIAKQVLEHLGGTRGVRLLADKDTLILLNAMAGGLRKRELEGEETEEVFDRRSRTLKEWQDLIARRQQRRQLPYTTLEDFTRRNIIRLGIETTCPHCQAINWHSLTTIDYEVTCERCLKSYAFPQASLRPQNKNWVYRVIGPFSVPDYARGSYSSLLALNVIAHFDTSRDTMTFSTALSMRFDGIEREADFVALRARDTMNRVPRPELIIGETKSLGGGELIKAKDLAKLRDLGKKLPHATIVISVMRDDFTDKEKKLLTQFVKWGRRMDSAGEPTNPVILLTGNELFSDFDVKSAWKKLGGRYTQFTDYHHLRNLRSFAAATQAIHLSLPSFEEERRDASRRRRARKVAAP